MPLEDSTCIDIVTRSEDGKITLVITDSGITTDPELRFSKLVEKVTTYVGYVLGDEFGVAHPESVPGNVGIKVLCATPPTDKMLRFHRLTNPEDENEWIGIEYELFEGSLPNSEADGEEPQQEIKRSGLTASRFTLANWIFRLALVGLFFSGIHRMVFQHESPWTPWLIAIGIWVARYIRRRRQWSRIKADLIAGGVSSEIFSKSSRK